MRIKNPFRLFLTILLCFQAIRLIAQVAFDFHPPIWMDIVLFILILGGFVFDPTLKEWTKDAPTIIGREDR